MSMDFYDEALHIGYPFIDQDSPEFSGPAGTILLEQRAIVDLGVLFGAKSNFLPGTNSLWLNSIIRSGDEITLVFQTDSAISGLTCTLDLGSDVLGGTKALIPDPEDLDETTGILVLGELSAWEAFTADGTYITTIPESPAIEPSVLQTISGGYVSSVMICNDRRVVHPDLTGSSSEDDESSASLHDTLSSGVLVFREGYNAMINMGRSENAMVFGAGIGSGLGTQCDELAYEPDDPEVPSGLRSGGPTCRELIYTINGIQPDLENNFTIQGSRGIVVEPDDLSGEVGITFNLVQRLLCG